MKTKHFLQLRIKKNHAIFTAVFSFVCLLVAVILMRPAASLQGPIQVTLNPSAKMQTIIGWEGAGTIGEIAFPEEFQAWQANALNLLVNELGINRVRLETQAGLENRVDYFSRFLNGQISRAEWRSHWHEAINDNGNPNQIDPSGFHFAFLDFRIDNVILPMKQRLEARGEKLFINLLYTGGREATGGPGVLHSDNALEYAEFMLAHFQHMQSKYGFVPDQVEIVNEPSGAQSWSPRKIGEAVVATAQKLGSRGFHPDFGAPSNATETGAISWFDQMIREVPAVLQHLDELSYHRYGPQDPGSFEDIGRRGVTHGIRTAMLEKFNGDTFLYRKLHEDLKSARVSAWQQFALAFPTNDNGAQYYWIDRSNPASPKVNMGVRTRFLLHYFRYIRSGAERIGATTTNSGVDPLAFINPDGKVVAVVTAEGAATFSVDQLPPGVYGVRYTTSAQFHVDAGDVNLPAGQLLQTSIPAAGVVTIFQKAAAQNADPVISNIQPDSAIAGLSGFTLEVTGSNFNQQSQVHWNGDPRPTTFRSSDLLEASISKEDIAASGTNSVTVVNPGPPALTSNAVSFVIGFGLFFAQFGEGDGVSSTIILINPSRTQTVTGRLEMLDSDGSLIRSDINGKLEDGSLAFDISPEGTEYFETDGVGSLQTGSARVISDGSLGGTILFAGVVGVAGVGAASPAMSFLVPVESNAALHIRTGLAVANPTRQPVTIQLTLLDLQGNELAQMSPPLVLDGDGHRAAFPEELFESSDIDFSSFRGSIRVTADAPVAAMAIRTEPGHFATLPVTVLN